MARHERAPFVSAGLLLLITVLTGVGTFTDYWGVDLPTHIRIYNWGDAEGNSLFHREPGWFQCVVVCQLMAFSFELFFLLLVIPAILFRKMIAVHAACSALSFIIFVLLTISVITFAVNIPSYTKYSTTLKVGWSWGLSVAADALAFLLLLETTGAIGYAVYKEYR